MKYKGTPAITTIVLHHTAVSRSVQPLQRDAVNTYHKGKWNSPAQLAGSFIGYNFFCEPTGLRSQERFIGEETIAQIGNNCDTPGRCGMVSYCMAGDFTKEKPTQQQIDDFRLFVNDVRTKYPHVVIKQHKDVAAGRTCAELASTEIQSWLTPLPKTKDDWISENERLKEQIKQLVSMVTILIKALKK